MRTETYPVSGHVGCGGSVEFFYLGPLGRLQRREPKQAFSELDPVILATSRLCFGRAMSDAVCASTQYRTL